MHDSLTATRRTVITGSVASLLGLSGCSAVIGGNNNTTPRLETIRVRNDTDQSIRAEFTLVYAQSNTNPDQPIRRIQEIPSGGKILTIDDFEGTPGFYSLTISPEDSDKTEVIAFNSAGNSVDVENVQFEVVFQQNGGIFVNLDQAGSDITLP
ncbi:uncharacterized protein HHUB_4346 (plasmid) [Halobacterium hubeiense]|uniref:Uncharacterized protein n=1 Tax=Halobacterium hubeiense TaxID=1407499 RepID=A0A0U5HYN2_9EURY|nr:hypothetical protein [Halobacterium hubeiense]CQH64282.1 uncharacterized protein HHUB_4346 [Halobacterium hubeiense]